MSLLRLYGKEMRASLGDIIMVTAVIVLLEILAILNYDKPWSAALGVMVPMVGLPLYFLSTSFESIHREWNEHTAYWLLSLPVREEVILGAKTLALLSRFIILTLPAAIGIYLFFDKLIPVPFPPDFTSTYIGLYVLSWFLFITVIPIVFLAAVSRHAVQRWGWLVQALIFVGGFWAFGKVSAWLAGLLDFLPWLSLRVPGIMIGGPQRGITMASHGIPLSMVVSGLLVAGLIFYLAALLLRYRVEV
ncbi:MAG: hypothetical protein PWP65_1482 [Clostridia bacterium]|nr:hypothetical protein [Clostridia bacterium]